MGEHTHLPAIVGLVTGQGRAQPNPPGGWRRARLGAQLHGPQSQFEDQTEERIARYLWNRMNATVLLCDDDRAAFAK